MPMRPMSATLQALVVTTTVAIALPAVAAPPKTEPRVLDKIPVGGEGGWDFLTVDEAANRLYVARASRVTVIDLAKKTVVGEVADTPGVHGVAIAAKAGRGVTSNGKNATATVFDLKTLAPVGTVKTGDDPDYIMFDDFSGKVLSMNAKAGNVTIIDVKTAAATGTIEVGGKLELAAGDGKGSVFVAVQDKHEIAVLDVAKATTKTKWPTAPCEKPTGLALDRKAGRLFVGCGNQKMVIMDAKTGKVLKDLPIAAGNDGVVYDPATKLAYAAGGKDAAVTVVSGDKMEVVGTVETAKGAKTIALDGKRNRVFLPVADFGPAPAPTAEAPKPKPAMVPASFRILVVGK